MKAVNLLPPDLRSAPRRAKASGTPAPEAPGGSGPFVVLGALAMCVVALAGYVLASNTVKERRAQLAAVTAEHQAAVKRAAELKPYGDFQALATRRIEGVTALASQRFDWDRAFSDLSRALPAHVTLSDLSASLAGVDGGGSSVRGGVQAPAIELKGCTRTQPGVAELMSRLRTIRGVTRVTLSRSETTANGPAAASTGVGASAAPCGKATAPKFEVVMFFERSTAGSAGSAAAAAAPGATATPAPAGGAAGAQPAGSATATPTPAAGQPAATPSGGTPTASQQASSATTTPASTPGATP